MVEATGSSPPRPTMVMAEIPPRPTKPLALFRQRLDPERSEGRESIQNFCLLFMLNCLLYTLLRVLAEGD